MAGLSGKRRKMSYFEDLVERLELGVEDQVEQQLVVEFMSAHKKDLDLVAVLGKFILANQLSFEDVYSKYTTICSLDEEEDKLVKQYAGGKILPPSAVTWNVLLRVGIVSRTAESFLAVASGKQQSSLLCQFDSGPLNSALVASATFSCYNEAILSIITANVIAQFVLVLRSKFQGRFGYEIQSSVVDQRGFPDTLVVYHDSLDKEELPHYERKVVVVVEIKTNVPLELDVFGEADTKNLAQLVYTGHTYSDTQDFMPLLVLTNSAIWHFFELDNKANPQRYCDVAVNPPDGLPVTSDTKFDAVGVFSEIVGFIQRNEKHFN